MTVFTAIPGQIAAGHTIGMLCAEWNIPFVPGDLNNAGTFDFPILYATVPGADGASILSGDAQKHTAKFVAAARELEARGVRAITSNCGYMAAYQGAISSAVSIPVFMSSLVQAPMLLSMIGPNHRLGVLVANGATLNDALLASAGVTDLSRLVVAGLEANPHWRSAIIDESGQLDTEIVRDEVLSTARALLHRHPDISALLLECSDLPPYSAHLAQELDIPVFDWAEFIRWVHAACRPRSYPDAFLSPP